MTVSAVRRMAKGSSVLKGIGAIAVAAAMATPVHAIVANGVDNTNNSIIDNANVYANVGRLFIDQQIVGAGGFVCTQTVINPRLVLTAAHCLAIGNLPLSESYDGNFGSRVGGTYLVNPISGPGGNVQGNFFGGIISPYAWVASDVIINPNYDGFFESDIAIVTSGSPIPTFAAGSDLAQIATNRVMMSHLDTLEAVTLVGYGNTAPNGATATFSSTRRRVAQNVLGFIGSQASVDVLARPADDNSATVFQNYGPGSDPDYQMFYLYDFDRPAGGVVNSNTAGSVPAPTDFDFNIFGGAAVAQEGMTAGGDSGGPMFVDRAGERIQTTVLTGGSRFHIFQNFSNFGTYGVATPISLFGNWVSHNNPYKWVEAGGSGNWSNSAHWTERLDPAFVVDTGGSLVNALAGPDAGSSDPTGGGGRGTVAPAPYCFFTDDDGFGLQPVLYDVGPLAGGFCDGLAAGGVGGGGGGSIVDAANSNPIGANILDRTLFVGMVGPDGEELPGGGTGPTTLGSLPPSSELALTPANPPSGYPGGTPPPPAIPPGSGFTWVPRAWVPDNTDGDTSNPLDPATYFDVNLIGTGTTTADIDATVDRLRLGSASRTLDILAGSDIESLLSIEITAGTAIVNGTLTSGRNVWILGGRVQGTGTVTANTTSLFTVTQGGAVWNLAGTVAPGNSIGTLTVVGDYVQGAAGLLEVELNSVAADLLDVSGLASLDGAVSFTPFGGTPLAGQTYTIVDAVGGVFGTFASVIDNLPGLLFPTVGYTPNTAFVTVNAITFCSLASGPVQVPVCNELDDPANQADPELGPAIDLLQLLEPGDVPAALESISPTRLNSQGVQGQMFADLLKNQFGTRGHDVFNGANSGGQQSALMRLPSAQLASAAPSADTLMSAAFAAAGAQAAPVMQLPNGYGLYLAGDYADGSAVNATGEDDLAASAFTAGIDYSNGADWVVGGAVSYLTGDVDQNYGFGGAMESDGFALSAYSNYRGHQMYADVYASYGMLNFDSVRNIVVGVGPVLAAAVGETEGDQFMAGGTIGHFLTSFSNIEVGAVAGLYYAGLSIDGFSETGAGPLGAVVPDREFDSLKGALGLEATVHTKGTFTPFLRVQLAHEFMDDEFSTVVGFVGAPASTFTVPGVDLGSTWVSVGGGVSAKIEDWMSLYVRYQGDIGREDSTFHGISAAARISF